MTNGEREKTMATVEQDEVLKRVEGLEAAQATQAATLAGAQATQAAMNAGTMATMAAGSASLIAGLFLGIAIAKSR